jgi:hypothetical protein
MRFANPEAARMFNALPRGRRFAVNGVTCATFTPPIVCLLADVGANLHWRWAELMKMILRPDLARILTTDSILCAAANEPGPGTDCGKYGAITMIGFGCRRMVSSRTSEMQNPRHHAWLDSFAGWRT